MKTYKFGHRTWPHCTINEPQLRNEGEYTDYDENGKECSVKFTELSGGLTKREFFAAQALAALDTSEMKAPQNIAAKAVKIADALIEALNEEPK